MGSKKVLGLVLAVLVLAASVFAFLLFTMKLFGIDLMEFLDLKGSGNFKLVSLAVKFGLFVLFSLVFNILAFFIAAIIKHPVFKLFDDRWLPKKGTAEVYVTRVGERLEKVAPRSFSATTLWDLLSSTIFLVMTISVVAGGTAALLLSAAGIPGFILGVAVSVMVSFLVNPWIYWVKEWRREHTTFVVFTFMTYYVKVRTPIMSLLFGIGTLPKTSKTPIRQLQEIQISADPQDFDPEYKTSWLHDQYISYLAKKKNVRTLFLRSIFNSAEDVLFWVDNGPGLATLINRLIENASQFTLEQNYLNNEAIRLKMEINDNENLAGIDTSQLKEKLSNRFKKVPAGSKVYDLFRVQDPGLYDSAGNPIGKQSVEEITSNSLDVSSYFSRHRK